jgi:predicted PurR-regulated permease PerM
MFTDNDSGRMVSLVNDISDIFDPPETDEDLHGEQKKPVVVKSSPAWTTQVQSYLNPAAEMLGQGALTMILVVFMLLRRQDLRNRAIRLLAPGPVTTTTKAVDETSRRISQFLLAQFALNGAFGVAITIGLLSMGIEYALLWGFTAFLMRYVPYIGTWIGVIPPHIVYIRHDRWLGVGPSPCFLCSWGWN